MSKWISTDEIIEFCDTERSMLNAHNGGNGVACAALRRVVDFVKEYAVETEPNKGWISVKDRLPEPFTTVLAHYTDGRIHTVGYLDRFMTTRGTVTHWMPLPQNPESEDDAE